MNPKVILNGLIEIYQNDFMHGYDGTDKAELRIIFLELILQVTRYVNEHSYCNISNCLCSPETNIRELAKKYKEQINNKLLGGYVGLSEVPLPIMREFINNF